MTPARLALTALFLAVGLAPAQVPQPQPNPPAVEPAAVQKHANIAYRNGPNADPDRHTLDVYVPVGRKNFPVILFVHGGSWKSGNKALYAPLGETFARAGIGVVITNYRLSPKVVHPAHVEDVAGALAWTCAKISTFGGDPKRIFLMGHSAGGHLVSLLATDPSYLNAEKRTLTDIRGVISVSGVYKIYHTESFFHPMFGKDAEACRKASPLHHVTGNHPPFLIAYADNDFEHLDGMAIDMNAALQKSQSPTQLIKCKDRNHLTIIMKLIEIDDPLNRKVREFIATNGK